MANLVSAETLKVLVKSGLTDAELDAVITRVEAMITDRIGAHQEDAYTVSLTETLRGDGPYLFTKRPIYSVTSITEDETSLDADDYRVWGGSGEIERLPAECEWGTVCVVVYKPSDQREERTAAIIDLVRLHIERTAMAAESVAGEYAYTAPTDWDAEMLKCLRRLSFTAV